MKIATQEPTKSRRIRRTEAVILFTVANQLFAIAADSVQEIRSTDSLGAALEIEQQEIPKVHHTVERNHRTYFVVNACVHFGLRVVRPTLVLLLRQVRVAVLVDISRSSNGFVTPRLAPLTTPVKLSTLGSGSCVEVVSKI